MSENNKLFRKKALDTISNPEQLDQHIRVTKPFSWIILIAIIGFIIGVGIWAFTGNLSRGIDLTGVIFSSDGVVFTKAVSSGTVTDVLAEENEFLEKGEGIVFIPDEELLAQIEAVKKEYDLASGEMKNTLGKTLDALKSQYAINSFITAGKTGYISSVPEIGSVVTEGQEIIVSYSEERMSGDKDILSYVPYSVAQNLKIGMDVQISPNNYPREKYGYILGKIVDVGHNTVTEASIRKSMGTTKYISALGVSGDCVEVRITISVDSSTKSGFEWSNSSGAENAEVNIGDICSIKVITDALRPINLFIK